MKYLILFIVLSALILGAGITCTILFLDKQPNNKTVFAWKNTLPDVTTNDEVTTERTDRRIVTHGTYNRRFMQNLNDFPFRSTYDGYRLYHIDAGTRLTDGKALLLCVFERSGTFYVSQFEAADKSFRDWTPVFTLIPLNPTSTGYCRISPNGDKFFDLNGNYLFVLSYDSTNNAFSEEDAASLPDSATWASAEWDTENNDAIIGLSNTAGLFLYDGTTVSIFAFNVQWFSQAKHHLAYIDAVNETCLFATRTNASSAFSVDATRTISLSTVYGGRFGTTEFALLRVFITGITDEVLLQVTYNNLVNHLVFMKYVSGAWVQEVQGVFQDEYLRASALPVGNFWVYSNGNDLQLCEFGQLYGQELFREHYLGDNWGFSITVDHQGGKNSLVVIPFSTDQIFGRQKEVGGFAHAKIFVKDLI